MAARGADLSEAWFDPGNGESAGQCPVSPFAEPKTLHPGDMPRRVTLTDYKGLGFAPRPYAPAMFSSCKLDLVCVRGDTCLIGSGA